MASTQSSAVINVLLIVVFGTGGWFLAAWTKGDPARKQKAIAAVESQPAGVSGTLAGDALRLAASGSANAREFDNLINQYGAGSTGLGLLVRPLMEAWAASSPDEALREGLPRCLACAPDSLPEALAVLAATGKSSPAALLAAVPAGPLREPCLIALAGSWGRAAAADPLREAAALPRPERTRFLTEWHRSRALTDSTAAAGSAAALADEDDQSAAFAGCLLARAASDPESALRESSSRHDFPAIAATAFRHWLRRDPASAWNFASSLRKDTRLPKIAVTIVAAETQRRRMSDALPEIQSLLNRLFPGGAPEEVSAAVIPALAGESTAAAIKFVEAQPKAAPGADPGPREVATVILFDALCATDPAAAWRLAESLTQRDGRGDQRATHRWESALTRTRAAPALRVRNGFPDFTDMVQLALHWLESDAPAAINTFCGSSVKGALQSLIIETALHPDGADISKKDLQDWARTQPERIQNTIEAAIPR